MRVHPHQGHPSTWACNLAFWLCHSSCRRWISGAFSFGKEPNGCCRSPPSLMGTSTLWRYRGQNHKRSQLGNDMVTLLTSQPVGLGGGSSDGTNGMTDMSLRFEKVIWHTILTVVALGRLSIFSWNHWISVLVVLNKWWSIIRMTESLELLIWGP